MKIKTIEKALISIGFPENSDGTKYAAYTIKAINECHGKIVMNKIYEKAAKKFLFCKKKTSGMQVRPKEWKKIIKKQTPSVLTF